MSGVIYFANPEVAAGFVKLGFSDQFRVELGVAKLIGAVILIVPQIPTRIKEWSYAGFGINFISAIITHLAINNAKGTPMIFFLLIALVVSNIYLHKTKPAVVQ